MLGTLTVENALEYLVAGNGVYAWYSYIEEFTGRFVLNYLQEFNIKPGKRVLDPFLGHGTTPLTCRLLNIDASGIDANPFCCFASQVKTHFPLIAFEELKTLSEDFLKELPSDLPLFNGGKFKLKGIDKLEKPAMPKLDRWISPAVVEKVLFTKNLISKIKDNSIRDFYLLTLASALREVSNIKLALNVTIMKPKKDAPVFDVFARRLRKMVQDYKWLTLFSPTCETNIIHGDSRYLDQYLEGKYDFVITSPPYPNDIDYINQTRLELFFLDFVADMQDLRLIKEKMVTSDPVYVYKNKNYSELVTDIPMVVEVVSKLRERLKDKNWGWDYPRMTAEYFGDMVLILRNLKKVLRRGAVCAMVVGDAAFAKVKIPADLILAEIAKKEGYRNVEVRTFRKRRATSHKLSLQESTVVFKR